MLHVLLLYGKNEPTDNPLALEYLRSYCLDDPVLREVVKFEIFTFENEEDLSSIAETILKRKPNVIAASCYVWNTDSTMEICNIVKKSHPQITVVLGGPEVSHNTEEILFLYSCVDVVVSGEGEETFREFLRQLIKGRQLQGVFGLTYRSSNRIYKESKRPLINLSKIPIIFHEHNDDYLASVNGKVLYETLRGCPHSCYFCDCGRISRGLMRFFPIERSQSEINFILSHEKVRHLYIADSEINVDNEHAKKVLRIINGSKKYYRWDGSVTFHFEISKSMDAELEDLIGEATAGIGIGVQSFNKEALAQMGRRWFNHEIFEANVDRLEKHVRFIYQFIYGCPGDNYETFRDSLRWAVDSDRDVWFDRLQILRGTIYRRFPERFKLQFEPTRPNYVLSCNTFSEFDLQRAETLKRGFILYMFRDLIHFKELAKFLGLDHISLLEEFGKWCTEFVSEGSMNYSRFSPKGPPTEFIETLAEWIGKFIKHRLL